MKKSLIAGMIFLLFIFCGFVYAIGIMPGETAPDFSLNTVDGEVISLGKYIGRTVVLIYWRPGQNRSYSALKDGQDIFNRYKEKGVQILGITANTKNPETINKVTNDYQIDYPVLLDPERDLYAAYGVRVYPTTIVINKNGKFAYGLPGHALTYKSALEGHIRFILEEINEEQMHEMISPHRQHIDTTVLEAHRRYNLALRFTQARLYDQAMEAVRKSIESDPEIIESHILSGFLYLEKKEVDRAIEDFNKAIELDPNSQDAKTGLGGALILKDDVDSAIEILSTAIADNPYPEMTYYELGRAYEIKGDKDKVLKLYKKALEKIIYNKIFPSCISR